MKKLIITVLLFASIFRGNTQTTIGGVFFSNTTLTLSNSPYHVTSNVLIPTGVSVKVEPGVSFYFDSGISWTVEGEFQAVGNANDSIRFLLQTGNTSKWGGLTYNQNAVPYDVATRAGCILDYCVISNAGNNNAISITINTTTVYVLHSDINNCYGGIGAYGSGDVIKHTHIHNCTLFAFSTFYGTFFPLPVIMDSCEINNINTGGLDALRLTSNVIFSNNNVHNITSPYALSIFEGPDILVENNNFYNNKVSNSTYNNKASAIVLINGSDASVKILNNNFVNNQINISKSACYSTPIVVGNNFYSYVTYNIYCIDDFSLGGPICQPLPNNSSFYTLDMTQNYFAHNSGANLDSSIYDLYDNVIGKTIIAYDTNIVSPYPNNLNLDSLLNIPLLVINPSLIEHSLTLYPNPFNDKLNILTNENGSFEFILYDILSRKILQQVFTNSITLNTEQLAKGIYIYEVRNKNEVIRSGKVVKD